MKASQVSHVIYLNMTPVSAATVARTNANVASFSALWSLYLLTEKSFRCETNHLIVRYYYLDVNKLNLVTFNLNSTFPHLHPHSLSSIHPLNQAGKYSTGYVPRHRSPRVNRNCKRLKYTQWKVKSDFAKDKLLETGVTMAGEISTRSILKFDGKNFQH